VSAQIESYDFSHAALALYDFVYGELCDWYIELVKHRLDTGDGGAGGGERPDASGRVGDRGAGGDREALSATLLHVMRETVALAHPVIPFVTEELWGHLGGEGLLAGGRWPQPDDELIDESAEAEVGRAVEAITQLRGWRDSVSAKAGLVVPARLVAEGYGRTAAAIARLARLELAAGNGASPQPVASVPVPGGAVEVLSAQGLDLDAAERRRGAARAKLQAEIERVQGKLANERFVQRAPQEVVEGEREKLRRLQGDLEAL